MRWGVFAILAIVTIVLQTTLVQYMAIQGIWPNWLFILAVHYALWGPWPEAAIAAWLLGLAVDLQSLTSSSRIGLYAFLFGGAAWAIIRLRSTLNRDHAVTHFLATLFFSLIIEILVEAYRHWGTNAPRWTAGLTWELIFTALYTAACAPYLHWLLIRMGRWTGLRSARKL